MLNLDAGINNLRGNKGKIAKILLYFVILLLFGITRLWKLTVLPYGMHVDEAGMAYDAWSLAEYGVDRHLKPWPVYLTNFGTGQSALYAYLCAALFKIFGYHLWLVRLPAVISSFLNLIFGMLITRKVFPKNDVMPLVTGGLLVICPYFIMAGRFGLDCNLMLGMSTVFLYCFVRAMESEQIIHYIWAGLTGGLLLYTYALSYLVLPVFLLLALVYVIRVKRFSLKGWFAMAVPLGILAFPLILVQIVNYFDLPEFQIGCFTITKMDSYRASEIGGFEYRKLFHVFDIIFFGDEWNYNTAPGYTTLYGITFLLFFLGLDIALRKFRKSVKKRIPEFLPVLLLWLISMLFLGAQIVAGVNRINGIFYLIILLTAAGINGLCKMFEKYAVVAAAVLGGIYLLCFHNFFIYYFGGAYTENNMMLAYFDILVPDAIEFIEQDSVLCTKRTQMAEQGIYYALSTMESPYVLDLEEIEQNKQYGNYQFETLGEIDDSYNYIVRADFEEYCEQLRSEGFMEERYQGYSVFYKK